jgi:hypothetical protein
MAPEIPLHLMGPYGRSTPALRRMRQTVEASETPLYLEGWKLGAGVTTDIATAGSFAAKGASFGPVGAAIGAGVGLVAALVGGLLAGHELRKKQAKNENQAVNSGIASFDNDLKTIQQALQSGKINSSDALTAVEQTAIPGYWTIVAPQLQPGRNGCQNGNACYVYNPAINQCKGNIGAGCCVACSNLVPSIEGPNGVLAAIQGQSGSSKGPHVAEIPIIGGSKYGTQTRGAYTLDFTPPATAAGSVTAALSSLSTGGSFLPLALLAGLAFLALR